MNRCETSSAGAGAAHGAAEPIARNLRRWRTTREMTLSALAEQAGVAKSTVSLIEHGHGNPSIDTVGALAAALGVPFASLLHDEAPAEEHVARARARQPGDRRRPGRAGGRGAGRPSPAHALRRRADRDLHARSCKHGAVRHAEPHVTGLFEHVTVAAGRVQISTDSFSEAAASAAT